MRRSLEREELLGRRPGGDAEEEQALTLRHLPSPDAVIMVPVAFLYVWVGVLVLGKCSK